MKVHRIRKRFKELEPGDVFVDDGGFEHMKIKDCLQDDESRNVVCFEGLLGRFGEEEKVLFKPDAILYPDGKPEEND